MYYEFPEIIAILGLVISSYVYYQAAKGAGREPLTLDGFTLSDRKLEKKQYSNTFSASAFSAMTIMFFFMNTGNYGLFLFCSPITYLAGQFFFIWLIKRSDVDFKTCRTISDVWFSIFPSKTIARLITVMTCTSLIAMLFVELFLGSVAFSLFLPDHPIYQVLAFLGMGILVLAYVRLGGYKALIKTDKWQLGVMMLAMGSLLLYSIFVHQADPNQSGSFARKLFNYGVSENEILMFAIWLAVINFLWPFTNVTFWQRVAASSSVQESWLGLIRSSWKFLYLFTACIVGFLILSSKGYSFGSFQEFLISLKTTTTLGAYIVFPIIVVGICSTVFSSADVSMIGLIYVLGDKNTFGGYLSKLGDSAFRRTLSGITLSILGVLTVIYWLQFTELNAWMLPLVYLTVSQLVLIAPLPIYVLLTAKSHQYQSASIDVFNEMILFFTMLLVWFSLLFSVWLTKILNNQIWTQVIMLVGAGVIFAAFYVFSSNRSMYFQEN